MYSYQLSVVRAGLSAVVTTAILGRQKTYSGRVVGAITDAVIAGGWKSGAEVDVLVRAASEKAFLGGMRALHNTVDAYVVGTVLPVNPYTQPVPDPVEESDV